MRTILLDSSTAGALPPSAVTVGFFDGVHLGHRFLIRQLKTLAAERGLETTVVTFGRHPREVLQSDWRPQLLSTTDEKAVMLAQTGIDNLVVLPFDRQMAALSAREFMDQILRRQLGARLLLTGYDNRFGHNRTEGFSDYVAYGRELGIDVVAGEPFTLTVSGGGEPLRVSSSVIRRLLAEGDVSTAASCLGRPYTVTGVVVRGEHVGTDLGFPTANLCPDHPCKLLPAAGAYAVKVRIGNELEQKHAMTNIGTRPTFSGRQQTLETHIFRHEGELYDQRIVLWFVGRLREERKFADAAALTTQLRHDADAAERLLGGYPLSINN